MSKQPTAPIKPRYFTNPAKFRGWLVKHHAKAKELHIGFHKAHTGAPTLTWPQSVAEALCFGWIDGIRRRIDDDRYTIRFTPRKPTSIWSAVNIKLFKTLEEEGRMTDAGRAAFARRTAKRSNVYSYEQTKPITQFLDDSCRGTFQQNTAAWAFFEAFSPSYRKKVSWWVMNAKQEETRARRLKQLIAISATGKRMP